jgi:hypothetical protein
MRSIFRTFARGGGIAALALVAAVAAVPAHAAGTFAGTTIGNKATLNYSVGSVNQNAIASSPTGSSNGTGVTTTFLVDNKVNVSVSTGDAAPVSSVPGQAAVTSTFSVSNTGNNTQDYALSVANLTTGNQTIFASTYADNFDVTLASCQTYVETGPGTNTFVQQGYVGSLIPDGTVKVKVVCPIPIAQVNSDLAGVSLTATTATAGSNGATITTKTVGADNPNAVDVVFADAAGSDDAANDGKSSARSAYKVSTAALTVTKTFTMVCDPVNGNTNPKAIPGAYVQYVVQIANNGSTSATLGTIGDTLDTNVSFDPDLITGVGTGSNCAAAGSGGTATSATGSGFKIAFPSSSHTAGIYPKYYTTTADADGAQAVGGVIAVNMATALPAEGAYSAGELKVGDSVQLIFHVKIN